jgi:hypothetical protein
MLTAAKFCNHLISLNVRHFGMVEVTGLRGQLQWHDLRAEFHKDLPTGSKVINGELTDRMVIL